MVKVGAKEQWSNAQQKEKTSCLRFQYYKVSNIHIPQSGNKKIENHFRNGQVFHTVDNTWVVPYDYNYDAFLLPKYDAHINFEICSSSRTNSIFKKIKIENIMDYWCVKMFTYVHFTEQLWYVDMLKVYTDYLLLLLLTKTLKLLLLATKVLLLLLHYYYYY